jgi:light-harvesting complex 1 alpha chain
MLYKMWQGFDPKRLMIGVYAFMFVLSVLIHFILLSSHRYNWLDPDGNSKPVGTADALTPMPPSR